MKKLSKFKSSYIFESLDAETALKLNADFGDKIKVEVLEKTDPYLVYALNNGGYVRVTRNDGVLNFSYQENKIKRVSYPTLTPNDLNKIKVYNKKSIKNYFEHYEKMDELIKTNEDEFLLRRAEIEKELVSEGFFLIMDYDYTIPSKHFIKANDMLVTTLKIGGNVRYDILEEGYKLSVYRSSETRVLDSFKSEYFFEMISNGGAPIATELYKVLDELYSKSDSFVFPTSYYYDVYLTIGDKLPKNCNLTFKINGKLVEVRDGRNYYVNGRNLGRTSLQDKLTSTELFILRNELIKELKKINKKVTL